jgi:hypothetical protein
MLMLESGTKGSHLLHRAKMSFVVVQWLAYQAKRLVSVKPPDANTGQCRITCPTAAAPPPAQACSFEIYCSSARIKEDMLATLRS